MMQATFKKHKYLYILILSLTFLVMQSCGRDLSYDGQSYMLDPDQDGVDSIYDNCPNVYNPAPQADSDGNGIGDACDESSSSNQSPVLYAIDILNVDGINCSRKIVWEDNSTQEVQVQIIKKYKRISFDPIAQQPDIDEFTDTLDVPIVYAGNVGMVEYDDLNLESWMKGLNYHIKVSLSDGTTLLSESLNAVSACE